MLLWGSVSGLQNVESRMVQVTLRMSRNSDQMKTNAKPLCPVGKPPASDTGARRACYKHRACMFLPVLMQYLFS